MWIPFGYLIAAVLFILGLKKLSHPRTAPLGNRLSSLGMAVAIGTALVQMEFGSGPITNWNLILLPMGAGALIGLILACKAKTTSMPELVALFNGFGGAASALVASAECWKFVEASELALPDPFTKTIAFGAAGFSAIIGWCTLTGSLLAVLKLLGGVSIFGKWWAAPTWGPAWLNVVKVLLVALVVVLTVALVNDPRDARWPILLLASSSVLGVLLVLPIGGADMPVVVSLLNSLSGIAAAFTGFIINNPLLLVAGSLVGASGFILTIVMCKAMNRTLTGVLFQPYTAHASEKLTRTKVGSDPEEVAMVLDGARKVIIVPGYGMAVSQSQHVVKEFAELLAQKYDTEVKYAIHPVAGRMPGHMNVLLAEANVPYEQMVEMDDINPEFPECDVALVIGANDTCNPAAREETGPLAGMPIINVDQAQHVVVVKRSLGVGYAGVDNDVFYLDKTMMLFGDAKTMMGQLNKALAES